MVDPNSVHSALDVLNAFEAEEAEKERLRREKEKERLEREFDKKALLEIIDQLKQQNTQLTKEYEESKVELKNSRKYNRIMLIIALASAAIAIASLVVAIVK